MKLNRTTGKIATTAFAVLALTAGGATGTAAATEAPAGSPAANECNYSTARPTLQLGDTGPAVKQAQCYLLHTLIINDLIQVNGVFDAKTQLRVGQFQRCAGLPANGVVGASTWATFEQYMSTGRVC
jgi:peptidoglycan hydrolase-like protein with peptidoglycan-binding domain